MEGAIRTERLLLRRFAANDLERLVALDSDPEVMRFLTGGKATPRAFLEGDILPRFLTTDTALDGCGYHAVLEAEGETFVGWVGLQLRRGSVPLQAELGFRLRRASWGRGYATEASRAVVDCAFRATPLQRVYATTFERNLASQRVLEKVGRTLRRRYRLTDADLAQARTHDPGGAEPWDGDELEYAVERAEWIARGRAAGGG